MSMHPNTAPGAIPVAQESAVVLLVDDQPLIAMVVRQILAVDTSLVLHVCQDAQAAESVARQLRPSVILQDLVMPGADGLELVRAYRMTAELKDVPIIVLSSNEEPTMKRSAFAAGANDYVVKLPEPIELVARIRYHSRAYNALQERDRAYQALHESQQQLIERNRELRRLMHSDSLTGLANRRHFDEFIANAWTRSRAQTAPVSLLMIDVDHFKAYNDQLGHLAGDAALQQVAHAIRAAHEVSGGLAARFGGEEFALVMPDTGATAALAMAVRLRDDVAALDIAHRLSPLGRVTVSIGAATATAADGDGPTGLIELADARLYEAKCAGRNEVVGA